MRRKAHAQAQRRKGRGSPQFTTARRAAPVTPGARAAATTVRARPPGPAVVQGAALKQPRRGTATEVSGRAIEATPSARRSPLTPAVTAAANSAATRTAAREGGLRLVKEIWAARRLRWPPAIFSRFVSAEDLGRQLTLARAISRRYLRSYWFIAEVIAICGLFALCFGTSFDAVYFYRIAGLALGLFALIATYALDHEVLSQRIYLLHSLRALGRPTVAPLVLAAAVTRIISFMLLLSLVFVFHRLIPIEPLAFVAGSVGLVANCVLIVAVDISCTTPFTPRAMTLGVMIWLVAALATYSSSSILLTNAFVSWLLRLPLLPFAACYNFGVTGTIGWAGLVALLAQIAFVAAAVIAIDIRLRHQLQKRKPRVVG